MHIHVYIMHITFNANIWRLPVPDGVIRGNHASNTACLTHGSSNSISNKQICTTLYLYLTLLV